MGNIQPNHEAHQAHRASLNLPPMRSTKATKTEEELTQEAEANQAAYHGGVGRAQRGRKTPFGYVPNDHTKPGY